jgi:hypothetical protein
MDRLKGWLARFVRENWLFLLVIGGIVVAFLALRTPASDVASIAEVNAQIAGGEPTLIEFYSNT